MVTPQSVTHSRQRVLICSCHTICHSHLSLHLPSCFSLGHSLVLFNGSVIPACFSHYQTSSLPLDHPFGLVTPSVMYPRHLISHLFLSFHRHSFVLVIWSVMLVHLSVYAYLPLIHCHSISHLMLITPSANSASSVQFSSILPIVSCLICHSLSIFRYSCSSL